MRSTADVVVRFAGDDDLVARDAKIDDGKGNGVWPRTDKLGNPIRSWEKYHQQAMNEIDRRLRSRKATSEPFEVGRLDPRSMARLRPVAVAFALHYLYFDADNSGDPNGFMASRQAYFWREAGDILDQEVIQLDYDIDRSGTTDDIEKNQPFAQRVIRG